MPAWYLPSTTPEKLQVGLMILAINLTLLPDMIIRNDGYLVYIGLDAHK
jgi:hypothetical protein